MNKFHVEEAKIQDILYRKTRYTIILNLITVGSVI